MFARLVSAIFTLISLLLVGSSAFMAPSGVLRSVSRPTASSLHMADVTFPGGKKTKANPGDSLKNLAKKAGYKAAYGCEEGKCGTCEHKVNGKKVRLCVGKLPAGAGPFLFSQ